MGTYHRVFFALFTLGACFGGCAESGDSNSPTPGGGGSAGQAGNDGGPAGAAGSTSDAQPPDALQDVSQDPMQDTAPDDVSVEESSVVDHSGPEVSVKDVSTEGIMCGNSVCSIGDQCCAEVDGGTTYTQCAPTCPDAGVSLKCDGPEDCDTQNQYCCAALNVGAGSAPNCPITSAVAACAASCPTTIPLNCPDVGQVRLCHLSADCDNDMPYCCEFQQGGVGVTFCVNGLMSGLAVTCY